MVAANQANFLDDGPSVLPVLGGLSDRTAEQNAAARASAAAIRADSDAKAKALADRLKASNAAAVRKIVADQNAASKAIDARTGGVLGDLKVIGKGVASAVGTAAKVTGSVVAVVPGGQLVGAALVAGGAALTSASKGDVKGAVLGAATAAAPVAGGAVAAAAKVAAPVVSAAKDAAAVLKTAAPVVQTIAASPVVAILAKGGNVAASSLVAVLPAALIYDAKNVDGVKVVADKLLALKEQGSDAAKHVIGETLKLSISGDASVRANAKAAITLLGQVTQERKAAGVAAGAERAVSSAGAKAAGQYVSGLLGMQAPLAAGVTVRSEQPAPAAFVDVIAAHADVIRSAPTTPAATSSAPAPTPTPAAVVESGFIVTADARILEGTRWSEAATGNAGLLGMLVRTSGPVALRADATPRLWVRTS